MDFANFLIQLLNSLQYGLLLFMLAAGLTLIFGIMGVVNLAHGSFYMLGAYLAWFLVSQLDSLLLAIVLGTLMAVVFGWLLEWLLFRHFYHRDHLDQVLLTFGLIYIFEELRSILWGDDVHSVQVPEMLNWSIPLTDNLSYPVYRLVMSGVCILLALGLYLLFLLYISGQTMLAAVFLGLLTLTTFVFTSPRAYAYRYHGALQEYAAFHVFSSMPGGGMHHLMAHDGSQFGLAVY